MQVAIIGAGMAGLACAERLTLEGVAVRILDKARGPGGRLATRRTDHWQADIGAQYFTARDPDFRARVGQWEQDGVVAPWDAAPMWLERGETRPVDDAEVRWVGVPRMSALTRHLAGNLPLELTCEVIGLAREDGGWRLDTADGPLEERFDAVVVALPAPQAAALLADAAPALSAEAANVPMQGCWAAVLAVDGGEMPCEAAFVVDHPLCWIARDGGKPGRDGSDTWVAHAGAAWSEERMEQDAEATLPTLADLFAEATGVSGPVRGLMAHKWRYSQSPEPHAGGCLFDAEQAIGACGDWCNGNRVEGAWLSGRALADRLLAGAG